MKTSSADPPISSIYTWPSPERPKCEQQADISRMAEELWHTDGKALLDPDQIKDPTQRKAVIDAAEKTYGRRDG